MTEETNEQPRYNVSIHNDAAIAAAVDQEVPKELLSSRSAGGNNSVTYLKGDISVDRLNEIFGPLGWGAVASPPQIEKEVANRTKWENRQPKEVEMVVYSVTTQVTLTIKKRTPEGSDTVFVQTGIGYGEVEPGKYAKEAIGMAVKGAETDGLKRCTSMLGKAFGMFLDQDGNQSDIEYAHKGNKTGLAKAKRTRQDRESDRGRDNRSGGGRNSRDDYGDDRQQGGNRQSRSNSGGDRSQDRDPPARGRSADRGDDQQGRSDDSRQERGRGKEQERPVDDKPAKSNRTRPKAEVNDDFDLDSEPVTRSDQVAYGATIVKRLKDARNKADREDLIRRHRESITNLEGNILTRLKEAARQHDIDIDKITG